MGIELLILLMCLLLSAFFSASETAYISLSQMKAQQMAEKKLPASKLVKKLKDEPSKLISIILIGNNIVNIGASVFATSIIISFFGSRGEAGLGTVLGIATGLITFILLVFGEIIPKNIAIRNAEILSLLAAWPLFLLSFILTPVAAVLTWIATPFIRVFGGTVSDKGPFLTEEDLKFLIVTSEKEGIIEKEEKEMISSIFEFGDTTVKEVMTPRPDIKGVDVFSRVDDVIKMIKETGYSRIMVYENNLDNIGGVVYAKDLIDCRKSDSLREFMRPVLFIPEGKKIDELLHQMQSNRTHIAVVVDEYGVTAGIVTLEDLIEEIVGEIHDEFEQGEKNIEKVSDNEFIVDGKVGIEDLNMALEIALPQGEGYDTLAGYVMSALGKMPSVGDVVKHEDADISVERVLKRRITRLKVVKRPKDPADSMVGG